MTQPQVDLAAEQLGPGASMMVRELEQMRARLLDLSARNSLLNYTHPKASSLRIVDEVPAFVLDRLVGGGTFRFSPLPENGAGPSRQSPRGRRSWGRASGQVEFPLSGEIGDGTLESSSDRERRERAHAERERLQAERAAFAESVGINPSYDLKNAPSSEEPQHTNNRLSTLLTADELEGRLQKIQASAVTAIQESGANKLHLIFGFIEWAETEGAKMRYAPLVLLPVTLARLELDASTHTFPYAIMASGEEWDTNVTLQEKCRREFGFVLPSIEDGENLEAYFAKVEDVLKSAPRGWRVRRQLTLGLVSFGKILMWRDLNPANWPAEHPLLGNRLLCDILGFAPDIPTQEAEEDFSEQRSDEYNIDELPVECGAVPPVVVPADSSQHSVLVDVQRGENLVVQGPPGTGKSQTITNIIADAIAAQKTVLFVAEKKAALEVVARRLVDAGLGPFCLPLHSHTSNKREFLDGLSERLKLARGEPFEKERELFEQQLKELREELSGHAQRLHAPFGSLGDTAFSILWRVRRLASKLGDVVVSELRTTTLANAPLVTAGELARQRATISAFAAAWEAAEADRGREPTHPWHGVNRSDMSFDLVEALLDRARAAFSTWSRAVDSHSALEAETGVAWPSAPSLLGPLLHRCLQFESPRDLDTANLVELIHHTIGEKPVRGALDQLEQTHRAWEAVEGKWGVRGELSQGEADVLERTLRSVSTVFGDDSNQTSLSQVDEVLGRSESTSAVIDHVAGGVLRALEIDADLSMAGSALLVGVARRCAELPTGALMLRSESLQMISARERVAAYANAARDLEEKRESIDKRFPPDMRLPLPELQEMETDLADAPRIFPSLFSRKYRRAAARYRAIGGDKSVGRDTMLADVRSLVRYTAATTAFNTDVGLKDIFGSAAAGVHSPFAEAAALLNWCHEAEALLRGLEGARGLSKAVWAAPSDSWLEAAALTRAASGIPIEFTIESLRSDVEPLIRGGDSWDGSVTFKTISHSLEHWRAVAQAGKAVYADHSISAPISVASLLANLGRVEKAWEEESRLKVHLPIFAQLGTDATDGTPASGSRLDKVRLALVYLDQFVERGLPRGLAHWLASNEASQRGVVLRHRAEDCTHCLAEAAETEEAFAKVGHVDLRVWHRSSAIGVTLGERASRFARALEAAPSLPRYGTLLRAKATLIATSIGAAATLLEARHCPPAQLPDVYDYVLARTLAELLLRERPELDRFSGALHEIRRDQFVKLDEKYQHLMQAVIAYKAKARPRVRGIYYGPVRDLSEESLIRHEIDKVRAHVPIREMFKRAGRAIQSLKPCFMMGPQAVAQYLPPGLFNFDLIVMDEASQMRPEDALGAISRGCQMVVVGDPKQLGPTSFFDTRTEDDDEVEEAAAVLAAEAAKVQSLPPGASVLQRSESILIAAARRYPMRMLRWHYRSRYAQLIAFSNKEFYGNDLILFPHPGAERPEDGINFRAVDDAAYSSSVNHKEALAIVEAVRSHAHTSPERTLLVVTMNQRQRELVDTLIQQAEKDDDALVAFRARHEKSLEPFGVKNLENVQGDERDVIYISVTYGPNEEGVVAQNFGPVNVTGGERRLNVLFTRAKFRLDVFCSFDPLALRVTDSSPRGLCVLRDYLRYAKEGTLSGGRFTARDPDSDFEIEVARAVRGFGFDVHPQVGVAGYFLDLAVVDPKKPGRYALALECDGATYHSAKSARDRDRLRQGVLESLGWTVHRIWSTDWFRDPRGETQRIVRRLESLTS